MRVLNLDPGTIKCGLSILESADNKIKLIDSVQLILQGKSLEARLYFLFNFLDEYLTKYLVDEVALEETFVAPIGKFNLDAPLKLSMARGIVWAIAGKYNLKVFEYSNGDVKKSITRNHSATKQMIIKQITQIFGKNGKVFEEDEADSIAIGITHLMARKLQNT